MKKLRKNVLNYLLRFIFIFIMLSLVIVVPFQWFNPPVTMVMADRWLGSEDEYFKLRQQWLAWDELPKRATLAVVTSEDQLFPKHSGFDFKAIWSVLRGVNGEHSSRGASTISQQVARNMYLWTGRSWVRKGLEAWFTVLIELTWSKQRILEVYMNIAEWGEGVFGLEAASHYHFNKAAKALTPKQMALLASCLPSPLNYNPAQPQARIIERAEWNLLQQERLGGLQWLDSLEQ